MTTRKKNRGNLTISLECKGDTTVERLQWFLNQINNGDVIDDVTISGNEMVGVTLHSEQGEDFMSAWTFTHIQYDLNNDGKRIN